MFRQLKQSADVVKPRRNCFVITLYKSPALLFPQVRAHVGVTVLPLKTRHAVLIGCLPGPAAISEKATIPYLKGIRLWKTYTTWHMCQVRVYTGGT